MPRTKKSTTIDQARRLQSVQALVKDMKDATPGLARDLRREAIETLDDVIAELVERAAA